MDVFSGILYFSPKVRLLPRPILQTIGSDGRDPGPAERDAPSWNFDPLGAIPDFQGVFFGASTADPGSSVPKPRYPPDVAAAERDFKQENDDYKRALLRQSTSPVSCLSTLGPQ